MKRHRFCVLALIPLLILAACDHTPLLEPEIVGSEQFKVRVHEALVLLQQHDPAAYEIVAKNVGRIQEHEENGMCASNTPPVFKMDVLSTYYSGAWCAATIARESFRSKLYHDCLRTNSPVPAAAWTGRAVDRQCMEHQLAVMRKLGASEEEFAYAKTLLDANFPTNEVTGEPEYRPLDTPADPLVEASHLADEGKYEEALQIHLWFHNHVLERWPAYYGVRLSYALHDWVELGRKYPKALATLKSIRETKTSRLFAGEQDRDLFIDVEAINRCLTEPKATVELFIKIEAANPEFAASIYSVAEEDLVAAQEYTLARKYLGDPLTRFAEASQRLDRGREYARTRNSEASRQAHESIFTERVVRIITVLDKTGDPELARAIQSKALAVLDNSQIRDTLSH